MSSQPAHVRPKVDRAQRASSEADPAERERERRPYAPYRMVPAAYVRIPLVEVAAGAAPRVLSVAAARWSLRSRPFPNLLRFDQARSPSSMRMLSGLDVPGLDKLPPVLSLEAAAAAKPREVAPFLRSLRRMLETESDDILRWTSNGRAFEILDMDRMMEEVLPKYFKHRKYTSFQRQLNYFSFKKWTKSKAVVCTFSNDCFLRDRPDLAWRITRKKSVHSSTTSSSKSGGSTPRKPRPMSVPVPSALAKTSSMKLEPLKLEPLKLEPQPFPSKSSWKRDIAIRVPRAPSAMLVGGPYGSGRPFPSPTDMDMMLLENDVEPQRYCQSASSFVSPPLSEQEVDSLEWIDNFLPSLEAAPRQEEPVFLGNTVNVGASALLRQAPHYLFPSLQPPSGGDYACLASM